MSDNMLQKLGFLKCNEWLQQTGILQTVEWNDDADDIERWLMPFFLASNMSLQYFIVLLFLFSFWVLILPY